MPRFFVDKNQISDDRLQVTIVGDDAHHVARSLRMAVGEQLTVCEGGMEYTCEITAFEDDKRVTARVLSENKACGEPPYTVTLYQALPKGDKLDTIIQKAVECGAAHIVPFESEHCVVRMRADAEDRKTERRLRIAIEAAKQCGRASLPRVSPTVSFDEMLRRAAEADIVLFCYEGEGTQPLKALLAEKRADGSLTDRPEIAVVVGSEGGFSPREAQRARESGCRMVGLGSRILRTETASPFILGCLVYEFEL